MKTSGELVVFEGTDGCGKTGTSQWFASEVARKGYSTRWMNFPNRSTFFGKLIDAHLKGFWESRVKAPPRAQLNRTEHHDFAAAYGDPDPMYVDSAVFQAVQTINRLECAHQLIRDLGEADVVVSDRYWMSGYAYGKADGIDGQMLVDLHATLPQPKVVFILDVTSEEARERMTGRKHDRYEQKGLAFFDKIRNNYRELYETRLKEAAKAPRTEEPFLWFMIDASGSMLETRASIWKAWLAAVSTGLLTKGTS